MSVVEGCLTVFDGGLFVVCERDADEHALEVRSRVFVNDFGLYVFSERPASLLKASLLMVQQMISSRQYHHWSASRTLDGNLSILR